jgi:hypothetical protein
MSTAPTCAQQGWEDMATAALHGGITSRPTSNSVQRTTYWNTSLQSSLLVCVTETPVGVGRLQSRYTNRIARAAPAWSLSY